MAEENNINYTERLFLIDGTALAYRSHFAFQRNPLTDSKGRNISAVYGFFVTLMSIIEREKPEYLVISFDTKAPTFRHQIFPDYKATRQKMPQDMVEQLPILRSAVEATGIKVMEMEGFEADDLLGTAAKLGEKAGMEVMIVTGDKDFFQLVSDKVKVYNLRKGTTDPEILGPAEVKEKFGVLPEKVIEVLGLMGDSSDHIPGVEGIGPKNAVELIDQFGDIEKLFLNLPSVKESQRKKLEGQEEKAKLSHQLVIIKTDCPVEFDPEEWKLNLKVEALREKFQELQFFSLMKYLPEAKKETAERELEYSLVDTPEALAELVKNLKRFELFAFDTETTSEFPMQAELVGLSFSFADKQAFYIPGNGFKMSGKEALKKHFLWLGKGITPALSYILSELQLVLEDDKIPKTAQNAKYDELVLRNYGIEVKGLIFDTMLAHYLLEPGARAHNLDLLSLKYLKIKKIPTSDLIGSGSKQISMAEVPIKLVCKYSCEDADCTFRLTKILQEEVDKSGLTGLLEKVELPLIDVLLTLEKNGVAIDREKLGEMSNELYRQLEKTQENIYRLAGTEFNIDSPKQLAHILFEKLNLPVDRKTKTGYSTDEGVLKKLSAIDPIAKEILEYRTLAKLKNTYTDALPRMVNLHTGRIHTSYNQTVTATGRLSSSDPNLQNIPVRTEIGGRIREAFVPGKSGWKILSADYSQIELRILAHLSQDERLITSFRQEEDIHKRTAALVFNSPLELVTPEMRRAAKEVNFGVIYGMRDFGLSERLGIPRGRAKEIIDSYFNNYPQVFKFVEETINNARQNQYVTTICGRKRFLPEINSTNHNIRQNAERIAVNTPIQGSAADMIKLAMIKVNERMKREKVISLMIMQVHDELVFEVPEKELELMKNLVVEEMENAMPLSLPVKVDASFGENWLEAH